MPPFSWELQPSEAPVLWVSGNTSKNYLSLSRSTAWVKAHATFSDCFSFSWNWLGNKQQRTTKPTQHLWRVVTPIRSSSVPLPWERTPRASLWRHRAPSTHLMSTEGANARRRLRSGVLWAPPQSKQIQNTALESKRSSQYPRLPLNLHKQHFHLIIYSPSQNHHSEADGRRG